MSARVRAFAGVLTIVVGLVLVSAQGRPPAPERTPWGDPDIQGVFTTDDELGVDGDIPDVFEYACHEGNYATRNILSAARAAEE